MADHIQKHKAWTSHTHSTPFSLGTYFPFIKNVEATKIIRLQQRLMNVISNKVLWQLPVTPPCGSKRKFFNHNFVISNRTSSETTPGSELLKSSLAMGNQSSDLHIYHNLSVGYFLIPLASILSLLWYLQFTSKIFASVIQIRSYILASQISYGTNFQYRNIRRMLPFLWGKI